jgi:ubiquinone/menaquinone biosynthesis C-methylase UbiE
MRSEPATPRNLDEQTVAHFGEEWTRFDQSELDAAEHERLFWEYFSIFPWSSLPANAVGFDLGCGTGRWARLVAPRVGTLHLVDASAEALEVARRNVGQLANVALHHASVDALPFADGSMDFGYSLGVLHHVPDTAAGLAACVRKLKPGAPFLVYLYYAFDNRPAWYRALWKASDVVRKTVSRSPRWLMHAMADTLAATVYFPLARAALLAERAGLDVKHLPLAAYRGRSFYTMRTDALDRFGTRLEQRFTRREVQAMMEAAGLEKVVFGDQVFWCAVGTKRAR